MAKASKTTSDSQDRMATYRDRMRTEGLRPVQMWVPDTRSAEFRETCRRQARAIAASEAADDELMRFVEDVYEWPDP